MTTILLTLILGGSLTEHAITAFSYDTDNAALTYTEGGIVHLQQNVPIFIYNGVTLTVKTDYIFDKGNFDGN